VSLNQTSLPEGKPSDNGTTADFPFGANAPQADVPTGASIFEAGANAPAGPDPFDPAALRLPQDFTAALGVKKALLSVPVRKPDKAWFVRVHPAEEYRLQTAVIELKADRGGETYLVAPSLWPELATEPTFSARVLFTAMNYTDRVVFLWPIRLPAPDGRKDEWSRTALEAAGMAMKKWSRVIANMGLGAYDVFEASGALPDPEWPDKTFAELLRLAFADRFVSSMDHPILRRLRGEV
jgi:hypothetical protein